MRLPKKRSLVRNSALGLVIFGLFFLFFRRENSAGGFLGRLALKPQECLSLAQQIRITSNFTINDLLDKMTLSFSYGGLKAVYKPDKQEPVKAESSIDKEPLHIIVIPHSHNDPGWLKTYDKYFEEDTTHILSLAVEKLTQYPDMTFIWVETCFLQKWWQTQSPSVRQQFKELVKSGRIELVSGSYVAPDEASPHYFSLVDEMIEGHYWVKNTLGVVPETSLSFDQFGYSASIPYLMKLAGIKNVLIKRAHRGVKHVMGDNHWMTFKWRQYWDPQGYNDILAQIDTYEWMSISDSCGPDRHICRGIDFSIMPDLPKSGSPEANKPFRMDSMSGTMAQSLDDFVHQLVNQFRTKSSNYKQKAMLLPHGGDFHYSQADKWDRQHRNMKLFMDYINQRENEFKIKIRFGTFKDYFAELERQRSVHKLDFPVVSGDFFTYAESQDYWTGYFTTRQFDKRLGRELQESLRAAELFAAISFEKAKRFPIPENKRKQMMTDLVTARQNLGLFQHHDAITGTSRAHVVKDYEERLSLSFTATQNVLTSAIDHLLQDEKATPRYDSVLPTLRRRGFNQLTERVPVALTPSGSKVILMNPLTQSRDEIVSLTVESPDIKLFDHKGSLVEFEVIPQPLNAVEIVFHVSFAPLSILVYTIQEKSPEKTDQQTESPKDDFKCENNQVNVTFSAETGSPSVMCYKKENICSKVSIDWRYYQGRGGAYTMISHGKEVPAYTSKPTVHVIRGKNICRVESDYGYYKVTTSLALASSVLGRALRVDIYSDLSNRNFNGDLAMRIQTPISNNKTFFADSNSVQLMGRKFRDSIPFDGNVYPMSSVSMIEDDKLRMIVHSAQPHGVISPVSGVLDLMIDRVGTRSEMGMPEGVTDNKPTKTILFIEFQTPNLYEKLNTTETALLSINSVYLNDLVQHPVYKFYSLQDTKISKTDHSFLKQTIPCDIILANVKNLVSDDLDPDGVSLTFHRRGVSCPKNLNDQVCHISKNTQLNPGNIFKDYSTQSVRHMYMSHLMTQDLHFSEEVAFKPMDFKTFHVH